MGANSPVTIISSSPEAFRLPSATPVAAQKAQSSATNHVSSSPGLPSPSTFVRRPSLKSGSRAQQLPAGANVGFGTAASLLKLQQQEETVLQNATEAQGATLAATRADGKQKGKEATGKLVRPKKAIRSRVEEAIMLDEATSPRFDSFVYPGYVAEALAPGNLQHKGESGDDGSMARRLSLDLSEYSLNAEPPVKAPENTEDKIPAAKKPRKRAAKPADATTSAAKKPRKQKAKSEAIILNSDEPGVVVPDDTGVSVVTDNTASLRKGANGPKRATKPKEPRAKKPKAPAVKKRDAEKANATAEKPEDPVQALKTTTISETSAYFAQPDISTHDSHGREEPTLQLPQHLQESVSDVQEEAVSAPAEEAFRRRRSWTPAKDSAPDLTQFTVDDRGADETIGQRSLGDHLGSFSYVNSETTAPKRAASGESMAKRRRIELLETAALAAPSLPVSKVTTAKATKKAKSPRKRPQTITALATAAYKPVQETESAQSMVSEFFAPRKPESVLEVNPDPEELAAPVKVKKPRKPRAKPSATDGNPPSGRKPAKSKKAKVNGKEVDLRPPLLSPAQAREQMKGQDFLFGTSSQLAAEDSPTFIRQIQMAVQESENFFVSQPVFSPQGKSYARVPTAPHGTSLSVGQAVRELWIEGSRDKAGEVLAKERAQFKLMSPGPAANEITLPVLSRETPGEDSVAIDLSHTELPPAPPAETLEPDLPTETVSPRKLVDTNEQTDDWAILSSSGNLPRAMFAVEPDQAAGKRALPRAGSEVPTPNYRPRSISPARSLSPSKLSRIALKPLDANISLARPAMSNKPRAPPHDARGISTLATISAPLKRGPGRPRKTLDPAISLPTSLRRGRPRKDGVAATSPLPSPKRVTARPRKEGGIVTSPLRPIGQLQKDAPQQRRQNEGIVSPFRRSPTQHQTEWQHIDDISDHEPPATPSPPRRRASSPAPGVTPLDLAISGSPSTKSLPIVAAATTLKATDAQWLAVQQVVFPQINASIKSAPRSTDPTLPSWHEKILLYDPIVLEDLTLWLNAQGLCTEVQRLKPKVRGRRRKDYVDEGPQYEVVREGLKPWMVQKWCEEKSICCLWKEGMRGGVKARY